MKTSARNLPVLAKIPILDLPLTVAKPFHTPNIVVIFPVLNYFL